MTLGPDDVGLGFSCTIASGSAAAIDSAVAIFTGTRESAAEVSSGSSLVPKRSESCIVAFKIGVSSWGIGGSRSWSLRT